MTRKAKYIWFLLCGLCSIFSKTTQAAEPAWSFGVDATQVTCLIDEDGAIFCYEGMS